MAERRVGRTEGGKNHVMEKQADSFWLSLCLMLNQSFQPVTFVDEEPNCRFCLRRLEREKERGS